MALRAHTIEPEQDPETGEVFLDVDAACEYAVDAIRTMYRFGGMLNIGVDRSPVGEVAGEPIMETQRFLFFYNTSAPTSKPRAAAPAPVVDTDTDTDDDAGEPGQE